MRRGWQAKPGNYKHSQSRPTAQKLPEDTAPKGNLSVAISSLGNTWMGDKGETYRLRLNGKLEWVCHRHDAASTRMFTVWYEDSSGLFWWGLNRSFFFDSADVAANPCEVKWFAGFDKAKSRPRFVWRAAGQPPLQLPGQKAEVKTCSGQQPTASGEQAPAAEPKSALPEEATLRVHERPITTRPPPPLESPPRPPPGLEHLGLEGQCSPGFADHGRVLQGAKPTPDAAAGASSDADDGETSAGSAASSSDCSETEAMGKLHTKHVAATYGKTSGPKSNALRANRFGCVSEAQGLHDAAPPWPPQNAPWLATGGICNSSYADNWHAFENSLQLGSSYCGHGQLTFGRPMGPAAGSGMHQRPVEMH